MNAQSGDKIRTVYNTTAGDYANDRIDGLSKKHFDSLLLTEFARVNRDKGLCADFGCGPGQTTKFLYDRGLKNLVGVDISPEMIETALKLFPEIRFETGDLLDLSFDANYFGSAIAFYAIVHFNYEQIRKSFSEVSRVLNRGEISILHTQRFELLRLSEPGRTMKNKL